MQSLREEQLEKLERGRVRPVKILDDNDETKDGWSMHPKAVAMSPHGVLAFSPDDIAPLLMLPIGLALRQAA